MAERGTINGMREWAFWSRDLVGATEEDRLAHERGEMTAARLEELVNEGNIARDRLSRMPVPGYREWMEGTRRRLN